jgi:transposase
MASSPWITSFGSDMSKKRPRITAKQLEAIMGRLEPACAEISSVLRKMPRDIPPFFVAALNSIQQAVTSACGMLGALDVVKDSSNSHLPSGKEIGKPEKPKKRRKGRRGGKKNHKGATHKRAPIPDEVIKCPHKDEEALEASPEWERAGYETRQVQDIRCSVWITNYVSSKWRHIPSGVIEKGHFPPGVNAPFQYGKHLQAKILFDRIRLGLPFEKIEEDIDFLVPNIGLRKSTAANIVARAAMSEVVDNFYEGALRYLNGVIVAHFDETGTRVGGITVWAHYAGNEKCSLITIHQNRGIEGIEAGQVFPNFHQIAVTDRWKAYFNEKFPCEHAICNVHLSRDLVAAEQNGNKWAPKMTNHLLELKKLSEMNGGRIPPEYDAWALRKYRRIVGEGFAETGGRVLSKPPGKKGPLKKTPARNLLECFAEMQEYVLKFAFNEFVPYSNNLAERGIRIFKLHDKISGTFISMDTAQDYADLLGYISTCRLNGVSARDACVALIGGETLEYIGEWMKLPPVKMTRKAA